VRAGAGGASARARAGRVGEGTCPGAPGSEGSEPRRPPAVRGGPWAATRGPGLAGERGGRAPERGREIATRPTRSCSATTDSSPGPLRPAHHNAPRAHHELSAPRPDGEARLREHGLVPCVAFLARSCRRPRPGPLPVLPPQARERAEDLRLVDQEQGACARAGGNKPRRFAAAGILIKYADHVSAP